jgi:hypothetical protein
MRARPRWPRLATHRAADLESSLRETAFRFAGRITTAVGAG